MGECSIVIYVVIVILIIGAVMWWRGHEGPGIMVMAVLFFAMAILVFSIIGTSPVLGTGGIYIGKVVSLETSGRFYKTTSAILKTSLKSVQSTTACAEDIKIIQKLKEAMLKQKTVVITYDRPAFTGVIHCSGGTEIVITGMRSL